ncbi:hypothetical protein [Streptomyces sp. NRRL S-350]|uniref:hypothetical protein n=1 Tax=Streptomyces sp. NRRL S-350 TaxID=1463902 RepID=UPI0004C187D0|nr:hypothetical protein [Streptomyces sp. NRRL S-350]
MASEPEEPALEVGLEWRHHTGQLCAACETDSLDLVTVDVSLGDEKKPAGGFAVCLNCGATPHPTMEVPRGQ